MSESYGLLYKNRPDFDDLLYSMHKLLFVGMLHYNGNVMQCAWGIMVMRSRENLWLKLDTKKHAQN